MLFLLMFSESRLYILSASHRLQIIVYIFAKYCDYYEKTLSENDNVLSFGERQKISASLDYDFNADISKYLPQRHAFIRDFSLKIESTSRMLIYQLHNNKRLITI